MGLVQLRSSQAMICSPDRTLGPELQRVRSQHTTCRRQTHRQVRCQVSQSPGGNCARRAALIAPLGLVAWPAVAATSVAEEVAKDLSAEAIPNPGTNWALLNRTREVIYPESFAGEWEVSAKLANVSFPLGMTFITKETPGATKSSLVAALPDVGAGMDGAVRYRARFSSVQGGAVPDRVFNQTALLNAFLGYNATQEVDYDRSKNPQRMAVVYKTPRRDQSQQTNDLRKAELFYNASRFVLSTPDSPQQTVRNGPSQFLAAESVRQVNQARQSGFVYDYEIIQRFSGVGGGEMALELRVAAFLVPEAAGFFKTKGAAVALYDYTMDYSRVA